MIKTSCEDCVFAYKTQIFENPQLELDNEYKPESEQIGCKLGKLEKFTIENGAIVNKVQNHYEIDGRICMFCRNDEWAKDKDNLVQTVNEEAKIKHSFVIILHKPDDLLRTISLINDLNDIAYQIHIVNNTHVYSLSPTIYSELKKTKNEYSVQTIFNDNNGIPFNDDELLDIYLPKIKGNWLTKLIPGLKVEKTFSWRLNNLINNELKKFCFIDHKGVAFTAQTFTIKKLNGNMPTQEDDIVLINLVDKLVYAKQEYMIKGDEFCPLCL